MEPKIVTKNEIKVIGLQYIGNNQNGEIPKLWESLFQRIHEIKNGIHYGACYGICECICEGECKCGSGGDFLYVACIEGTSLDDIPEGMVGKTIPASKYAVFTHKGSLEALQTTLMNIYTKWIPAAGLEPCGKHMFELYDERFDDFSEKSELEIYVPVK
jgi:AraC family transcriptional regulator